METKNKSEYTEIFEVIVSIDQIVLNNDIFKISRTIDKIDAVKNEYMLNYKKDKQRLIIWFLIVIVLLQFGLNFIFPSLNSEDSNLLRNYVFPILYFGYLLLSILFFSISLYSFIGLWKNIRLLKMFKNTIYQTWLNKPFTEKNDAEFLMNNHIITFEKYK